MSRLLSPFPPRAGLGVDFPAGRGAVHLALFYCGGQFIQRPARDYIVAAGLAPIADARELQVPVHGRETRQARCSTAC